MKSESSQAVAPKVFVAVPEPEPVTVSNADISVQEAVDEIEWVHFEPLPSIEIPTPFETTPLIKTVDPEPQKIFEAPTPDIERKKFEPKMSAPLTVRPNPFL